MTRAPLAVDGRLLLVWLRGAMRRGLRSPLAVLAPALTVALGLVIATACGGWWMLALRLPTPPADVLVVRTGDGDVDAAWWRRLQQVEGVRTVLPRGWLRCVTTDEGDDGAGAAVWVLVVDALRELMARPSGAGVGRQARTHAPGLVIDAADAVRLEVATGDVLQLQPSTGGGGTERLPVAAVQNGLRIAWSIPPTALPVLVADRCRGLGIEASGAGFAAVDYRVLLADDADLAVVAAAIRDTHRDSVVTVQLEPRPILARARHAQRVAMSLLLLLLGCAGCAVAALGVRAVQRWRRSAYVALRALGAGRRARWLTGMVDHALVLLPAIAIAACVALPCVRSCGAWFVRSALLLPRRPPRWAVDSWCAELVSVPVALVVALAGSALLCGWVGREARRGEDREGRHLLLGVLALAVVVGLGCKGLTDAWPALRPLSAVAAVLSAVLLGPPLVTHAFARVLRVARDGDLWRRVLLPASAADPAIASAVAMLVVPVVLAVVQSSLQAALLREVGLDAAVVDAVFAFLRPLLLASLLAAIAVIVAHVAHDAAHRRGRVVLLVALGLSPRRAWRGLRMRTAVRAGIAGCVAVAVGVVLGTTWGVGTLSHRLQIDVPLRLPWLRLLLMPLAALVAAWLGSAWAFGGRSRGALL